MNSHIDTHDYYAVLHVDRDAPPEAIRSSYRTLMQRRGNHPDLGGDNATAAAINKAYAVLSDPEARMDYDARLAVLRQVAQGFATAPDDPAGRPEFARIPDPATECVFCETPHGRASPSDADARCEICNSPLAASENLRLEPADNRAVVRIRKRVNVTFFTDWRQAEGFTGRTEDVSLNGLRLITRQEVRKGQCIRILSSVVEAVGIITHSIPRRSAWRTDYVTGVSFVTLRFVRSVGGFLSQRA